ncbi:YbbR-like domain-containing protein [Mucilaginibacter sp. RS28]|uniref:YbbR-like domain-containing protein n=1 Tax=Mucilaginibacter straminoryzae TaxID=2932774 RepID=A0A9X1X7B3_9SPHI|nr:YbbR-like domain-containing protein [Mucilaginibacter straminoryzae]MCJ8209989.1 YbbR-like domain-containing protein [Mucilaginibacter straminoryzae]
MAIIKLSEAERRRLTAFITCLVLAAGAWILTALSSNYNYKVKRILVYNNVPQRRAFRPLQSDTVDATVQGSGWRMLYAGFKPVDERVNIDLHTLESQNYIALNSQLDQINRRKETDQRIMSFDPDTLYFDFTNRSTRRVLVKLLSRIDYQPQFMQSGNIVVSPAYVTLSGPSNLISKIEYWKTDSLKLQEVNESVATRVNLVPSKEANITIYPRTVRVQVPVDEFTEKTIEVPVKLVGNTSYYDVKIFPQKVKVTFTTSLSRYAETDENYFDAVADLTLWSKRDYNVLPVQFTRVPAYCKIVKIEPRNIDFIVKK